MLRAALGSEYYSKDSSSHAASDGPHAHSLGSSLIASGREDGSVIIWRRDRDMPITTLSGNLL